MERRLHLLALVLLLTAVAAGLWIISNDLAPDDTPSHYIPPEYWSNATEATPLAESEIITIVFAQQTIDEVCRYEDGILEIPLAALDLDMRYTPSEARENWYIDNTMNESSSVVMMRMPLTMFENFRANAQDDTISFPASPFCRFYDNMTDFESHLVIEGGVVSVVAETNDSGSQQP